MTTTPALTSRASATGSGDVLVAQLNAMRTRARRVLAVRFCVVAAGPALVAGHALAVARAADAAQTLTILTLSLAAGLGLAIAAALRRAPTLAETAAIVDRRLRLESRATTGLQFAAHDDPVSLLVMRDATTRLGACEPAAVFPIELPRRWPLMLGGAGAASLFVVALTIGGVVPTEPADGSGQGAAAGSAPPSSSKGSPRVVSPAQAPASPVERADTNTVAPRGSEPSDEVPAISRGASATAPGAGNEKEPISTPSRGTAPAGLANRRPTEVSTPSTGSSPSTGDRATAGASSAGATDAAGSARTGAGGAGAGTARNLEKGAGGVKGGTLTSPGPDGRLAATATPALNSARYRAEWERGQAAIARERVPPALRKYVRDYFAAIRPR